MVSIARENDWDNRSTLDNDWDNRSTLKPQSQKSTLDEALAIRARTSRVLQTTAVLET